MLSPKKLLNLTGAVLTALAVITALTGLWLNVALDGLHSNTCTAFVFTVVILGIGAWVAFGTALSAEDDWNA